jgi:RNA polymerase sigma-70 factor (ECF subfamily)
MPAEPADDERDAALLARIATGDQDALRSLYERYGERLFRYVHRLVGNESKAEEVTNDVMLEVWKNAARFEGRSRVSTWVIGIARYRALNAVRGKRLTEVDLDDVPEPSNGSSLQSEQETFETQRDLRRLLSQALKTLSVEHRDVVELTFFHGFSYPEIARIVGCPENTVKTRMFHARRKLKKALGESEFALAMTHGGTPA